MTEKPPASARPSGTFISAPFIEADASALKSANVGAALLGIPYDMGGIWRSGTADGPRGLRDASRQYGSYFFDDDVDLFEAFNLVDCGDVPMVPASPEKSALARN